MGKWFKQVGAPAFLMLVVGLFIGLGFGGSMHVVSSQSSIDPESEMLRSLYAKINPSVVSINVRISGGSSTTLGIPGRQGGQQPFAYAAGSGFVYDSNGDIVTNAHVVDGADQIEVTFSDDNQMHASLVGIDLDSDLAVIKVQGDASKYAPLSLADSSAAQVGDQVVAIGNPFTRAGTMTQGIVSGVHRSVEGTAQFQNATYLIPDAIQTDAALNPGNSGGPLLDTNGEVIGVNEQIASDVQQSSGVSFAIPSNLVKQVADALIKNGKIDHAWLGISGGSLSLDVDEALKLPTDMRGAYVASVQPGSPAANAGIQGGTNLTNVDGGNVAVGGDIIQAVDGQPVHNFDDLTSYLFTKTQVGQTVKLTVLRGGKTMDVPVTLRARPHTP
jgi:2-alkenal reductase